MTRFYRLITLFTTIAASTATAQQSNVVLSAKQIEVLAQGAIIQETRWINQEMHKMSTKIEGIKTPQIRAFYKMGKHAFGKDKAGSQYLNICTLSEQDILPLLSAVMTSDDDTVEADKNKLLNLKNLYGQKYWRFVSHICEDIQEKFETRLATLTSKGEAVPLSPETIQGISKLIFFPTAYGKPTPLKDFMTFLPLLIDGGFIFGGTSSLIGLTFAGVIISVTSIASSTYGIASSASMSHGVPASKYVQGQRDDNGIELKQQIDIDFNSLELPLSTP